uniref:Uncharacterized protein n=1 Tax=Oryza brachyantha TaxID=4533 RepID=J3LE53_ORYBR
MSPWVLGEERKWKRTEAGVHREGSRMRYRLALLVEAGICNGTGREPVGRRFERWTTEPVTCVVTRAGLTFGVYAATDLCVPRALLWTVSACSSLGYRH